MCGVIYCTFTVSYRTLVGTGLVRLAQFRIAPFGCRSCTAQYSRGHATSNTYTGSVEALGANELKAWKSFKLNNLVLWFLSILMINHQNTLKPPSLCGGDCMAFEGGTHLNEGMEGGVEGCVD